MRGRRRLGAALPTALLVPALLVPALLGAGVATASQLTLVDAANLSRMSAARCTQATLSVTPTATTLAELVDAWLFGRYSKVTVNQVPAACAGRAGRVLLHAANGEPQAGWTAFTFPSAATPTDVTVAVGTYQASAVTGVQLTAATWGLATVWNQDAPAQVAAAPAALVVDPEQGAAALEPVAIVTRPDPSPAAAEPQPTALPGPETEPASGTASAP